MKVMELWWKTLSWELPLTRKSPTAAFREAPPCTRQHAVKDRVRFGQTCRGSAGPPWCHVGVKAPAGESALVAVHARCLADGPHRQNPGVSLLQSGSEYRAFCFIFSSKTPSCFIVGTPKELVRSVYEKVRESRRKPQSVWKSQYVPKPAVSHHLMGWPNRIQKQEPKITTSEAPRLFPTESSWWSILWIVTCISCRCYINFTRFKPVGNINCFTAKRSLSSHSFPH